MKNTITTKEHERNIRLPFNEIVKEIRTKLKMNNPNCKFLVRSEISGAERILHVYLLKSDIKIIMNFKDIPKYFFNNYNYTDKEIEHLQRRDRLDVDCSLLQNKYNPSQWNNGIFLTKEGHYFLQSLCRIIIDYNYDNSDSSIDLFNYNFQYDIMLGTPLRSFIDGGK